MWLEVQSARAGCSETVRRPWVKNMYPKWNPGKWKLGLQPAVPWSFNFDPHPDLAVHQREGEGDERIDA